MEFGPQLKDPESSYEVRQKLGPFCNLVAVILGWICVKGLIFTKVVKKIQRGVKRVRGKNLFPWTITGKIFETKSSFSLK